MNTILIIDDEPIIRKLLARMMELEGYEVFQAADRASGLKLLTAKTPQLVLCDVFLPDGNGVEMVKEIKELQPETEVILLTAHGNIPDLSLIHICSDMQRCCVRKNMNPDLT